MPIEIQCGGCGVRLRAPDSAAGKTKKCPKCGGQIAVPAPAAEEPADGEIHMYELALESEPAPLPRAPDSVVIKQKAAPAPAAAPPSPSLHTGLGQYADAIASRAQDREDGAGRGPLMSVMGIDVTIPRLIGLLVVVLGLAMTGIWWTTMGPGRTHAVLSIRPVYLTPVLEAGDTIEPYSMLTLQGSMAAGIKGPGTSSTSKGGADDLPGGRIMTVGSSDQLIVTRDDKQGGHLFIELELARSLMNRLKQTSNYEVVFRAREFGLEPVDGSMPPLRPRLVYAQLDGRANIDISGSSTTDHKVIFPSGPTPTIEDYRKRGKRIAGGKVYWGGEAGVRGDLEFSVFLPTGGVPGGGFSGHGDLKITDPGGAVVDMQYTGGSLIVSWNAGSQGHWARKQFNEKEGDTPFTKYRVGLVFERPYTDQKLRLSFAGKTLATLDKKHNAQGPGPGGSAGSGVLTYFSLLGQARNKAKGIVSDSNMVQIGLALQLYVDQNGGKMPDRMDDLRAVVPTLDSVLVNPRTGDDPGFIYVKPADTIQQIQDPRKTVVIYESKGGRIDPHGSKLYADGHIEQGP